MAKQSFDTVQQFNAIKNDILAGNIKPVYLLFGKEHYYIDELCNLLIDKVLAPEERDFGQLIYYGADVTADQVVSAARQFPMMISRQLVVVKEAQMMKKVEDIGAYFNGIMDTTVLVICYKTPNDPAKMGAKTIDKRTTFYKKAQSVGVVYESAQIPDYKTARWIEEYISGKNIDIEPDAAALLAEYAGIDIQKIVLEVDKLMKILPAGTKRITASHIEENVGMSRDYSVYELTKALSVKDILKCYKIVHFFAESDKRFPIQMIMGALSSHFLKLLRFHALIADGAPRSEILSQLGINPYFAGEYDTAIRNYPVKKTMKVIAILKEYDYKSKSNARGNATDGDLLQELTARILNG
ncbi:MAG: DNA polymerase III subunit delta [Bacteroidales bacterium]|nr:DNA polymerase III subunit delta [Bacteroidales bacterium]MDD4670530.1 DNA polymerase III subunit delta [Bacteroidales bacterium]